ncbi:MAG: hypothetical protein J5634_04005 [Bacilli bacterium]|nr:hypothetical protein [Bacilli bacterium]
MDEFNTIDKVKKLFKDKGLDDSGIYLALLKDFRKYSGMVAGMDYPYGGLLLNIRDDGVGYFYLNQPKFSLKVTLEKLVVDKDSYTFLSNDNIASIQVKNFALLNKKRKELIIKTKDKKTHYVFGAVEDSTLPYHNENMAKLIDKYFVK